MLKFIAASVIASLGLMFVVSEAQAGHRGHSYCGAPAAAVAPVQAPAHVQAPAPVKSAQAPVAGQGYRTYSYQPAQPVYRSYSPASRGGRSTSRAYESAINKSLGRGF